MKLEPYFTLYTKINPKCIKDVKLRPETVKPLEENIGGKFPDIGVGNDFFGYDTKSTSSKRNKSTK